MYEMKDWYIEGTRWTLCKVTSNVFGLAVVELYTGQSKTGRARRGLYGFLVEPK